MYLFWAIYLSVGIAIGLYMVHDSEEFEDEHGIPLNLVFVVTMLFWFIFVIPAFVIAVKVWRSKKEEKEE